KKPALRSNSSNFDFCLEICEMALYVPFRFSVSDGTIRQGRLDGSRRQFAEIYDECGCRGHVEASDDLAAGMPACGALAADHTSVIPFPGQERDFCVVHPARRI